MADETSGGDPHDLTDLDRVGSETAEALREAGFESVEDVREASTDELTRADGVGDALAATIGESAADLGGDGGDESETDDAGTDQTAVQADGGEAATEAEEGDEDEANAEADDADADVAAGDLDMLEVRDAVRDVAETLIDDPFDGIIEIESDEEGWYAVVEVIERSAVPDTQDILGRYEIDLDESGSVLGYRLTDRYRRGDVSVSE